ncbi:hypothetical protein SLEP1_g547 [Rubroshorea leprosula]|uniref:Uncharacterized protein n=1 Tax=Rubroshorea leprosula TaxID=152421 RepID=A0AAV5HHV1_9ROSI|nr:hypothetical protein SLEP1_g547 [Rubroshorea leprosula]
MTACGLPRYVIYFTCLYLFTLGKPSCPVFMDMKRWRILQSLHRRQLKVDREALGLANRIQELLSNISEGSKDQESGLS